MFWGMTLYPGVEYTRDVTRQEYLTLASLDCRPQMNRGETNLTAYLVLKCDSYEHVLCTLVQGRAHQQILNFVLQEGDKMTLTVEGSGIVHVIGYTLKNPVLSDKIDTGTETTSMREVSDGMQDGEVLSPHPSSVGDDSTIIDEDIISEVKLENPNRFDLETVDTEEGSGQQFMDENALAPDIARDSTFRNDTAPEGTTIDSNDTLCATPESSVTNMTTSDHRWLNRENSITSNNLMQDTCNYALNIKEETEQISYQHVNSKKAVLKSNQTEDTFDSDVSIPATSESSTLNRGTNIYRQPSGGGTVSNNNRMENATYYTSFFEVKQEQPSDHHLTSMHAILTSYGTVNSDESTHGTAELSAMNTDTTDCRGPSREYTVCTNDVMGKTTDYAPHFEVKQKQASEQHLTSTIGIMTSNGTEGVIDSDESRNERMESSTINTDINDYMRPNREDTVLTDTVMENIIDYTSEFEEEREPASDQHLTSTNAIMNSNGTENAVDSDESIHTTAESSTTDLDTNDIICLNKKDTIPADSVVKNITDYDASEFEEEREQVSGQLLTDINAIMNSNEIGGTVDSDKSTPAARKFSTIHTDTLAYKGPNKEGTVPADSVMKNITDYTSEFEEEREPASEQHLTSTNAIINSNGTERAFEFDKYNHATAVSSTVGTDTSDVIGPNNKETILADSVMENISDCNTSEFEEEREKASGQHLTSANVIIKSNKIEGTVGSDKSTPATAKFSTIHTDTLAYKGSHKEGAVPPDSVMENITDCTSDFEEERGQTSRQVLATTNVIRTSNEAEDAADSDHNTHTTAESSSMKMVTNHHSQSSNDKSVQQFILDGSDESVTQGTVAYQQKELLQTSCKLLEKNVNSVVNSEAMENGDVLLDNGPCQAQTKRCIVLLKRIDKLFSNNADGHPNGTSFVLMFNGKKVTVKDDLAVNSRNHIVKQAITSQSSIRMCYGRTLYKCQGCLKTFSTLESFTRHINVHINGKFLKCDQSGENFNDKAHLKTHESIQTGENNSKGDYKTQFNSHKRIHTCKYCGKNFNWKASLIRHERIHTGEKPYCCKYCDEKFRWESSLEIHESKHTGKQLACEHCNKKFSHKLNLHLHKKIHNGEKPFKCKWCEMKFRLKTYLESHERIHTGEKPFTCNHCNRKFRQKGTLRLHERIHTREKPFTCRYCDRKFNRNEDLMEHEKDHTSELLYTCKHCYRKFRTKYSLYKHEIIHTGKKPFECEHCDMKFYWKGCLIRHKRIHTGEKPYTCKFCNKKFNQKSYLKRHERIHTDEKPYSCEHCDKKFRWRNTLVIHENVHTGMNRSRGELSGNEIRLKADLSDNKNSNEKLSHVDIVVRDLVT